MVRSQRYLVVGSLLLIAWILHATFCKWAWRGNTGSAHIKPILVYRHPPTTTPRGTRYTGSGLFAQSHSREIAVGFGVVVPIALCAAVGHLVLGWRHQDAVRRGRCPQCGYDRRGDGTTASPRCPECGWRER